MIAITIFIEPVPRFSLRFGGHAEPVPVQAFQGPCQDKNINKINGKNKWTQKARLNFKQIV
jgi:hypothetical protein